MMNYSKKASAILAVIGFGLGFDIQASAGGHCISSGCYVAGTVDKKYGVVTGGVSSDQDFTLEYWDSANKVWQSDECSASTNGKYILPAITGNDYKNAMRAMVNTAFYADLPLQVEVDASCVITSVTLIKRLAAHEYGAHKGVVQ